MVCDIQDIKNTWDNQSEFVIATTKGVRFGNVKTVTRIFRDDRLEFVE